VKNWILNVLFARFLPHRAAIGVAAYIITDLLASLQAPEVCGEFPGICSGAIKVAHYLSPLLIAVGIRDQNRK